MNCPFKKNASRILSLILALTLVVGMLSGCFGSSEPTEPQIDPPLNLVPSEPTEEPTTGNPVEAPTEDATEPTYDENTAFAIGQVNIVSTPSTKGNVIGYLNDGDQVEILQVEELFGVEWALIRDGWVAMDSLKRGSAPVTDPDTTEPESGKDEDKKDDDKPTTTNIKATVTASQLLIRKEPSTTGAQVGSYTNGTTVTILETKNGWGRTDKGWISMKYVETKTETTDNNKDDEPGNTTNIKAVVTTNELNIRSEASTAGERKGAYVYGDRITILETKGDWGRTDKGWISMNYVYQDGKTGTNPCKGIVTGDNLNVRSGPGTGYDKVGSLSHGDRVNILQRITYGNTTWGCTKDGWISLDYIYVDGTTGEGSGNGTVTGNGVNIRSGPGTGYDVLGSLNKGDDVTIYAQFKIGTMTWGCTDNGWISMDFVDLDTTADE